MPEDSTFYIVSVAGGKCLQNTGNPYGALACLPKKDEAAQQWLIEDGEIKDEIAIKSCTDGKYLQCVAPYSTNGGKIGVGEKQWWKLEQGRTPGSCLLRSTVHSGPASYLNDFQGRYQDNNYVHMWRMEPTLEFWLTWYLKDASETYFWPKPASAAVSNAEELESLKKELEEKTGQLQNLSQQSELAERKLREKDEEIDRLSTQSSNEKKQVNLAYPRPSSSADFQRQLAAKSDQIEALTKQISELSTTSTEAAPSAQGQGLFSRDGRGDENAAKEVDLTNREEAIARREDELERKEAELVRKKKSDSVGDRDPPRLGGFDPGKMMSGGWHVQTTRSNTLDPGRRVAALTISPRQG